MLQGIGHVERRFAGVRSVATQIGWLRIWGTLAFLLIALAGARMAWQLPFAGYAERGLYDWRFFATADVAARQDPRIVLVTFTDDTVAQSGKRWPLDRKLLARTLVLLTEMKPKAVGINILLDDPQPEDAELILALKAMKVPTALAFLTNASDPDAMDKGQEAHLRAMFQAAAGSSVVPADILLPRDEVDGEVRRWPSRRGRVPPNFINILSRTSQSSWAGRTIRFSRPRNDLDTVFVEIPIQFVADFPQAAEAMVAERYVLIGRALSPEDDVETPISRLNGRAAKAVEIEAEMLAQALDGKVRPRLPGWLLWFAALCWVAMGAATGTMGRQGWKLLLAFALQCAAILGLPLWLQDAGVDTYGLPAAGWGVGWMMAFLATGTATRAIGADQRRFAQGALGKYLPPDVAREIIREPARLALHGEQREIYAVFTDLEGFTALSHAMPPRELASLLNRYLDAMSRTVLELGGTIDKFVGDAVVAFWGAPLARPDDGARAVQAAIALHRAGERFAREVSPGGPPVGCTRVGVHRGMSVVGNFGGEGRIQYTALGDAMNTAARLESANKILKTRVLVSAEALEGKDHPKFRPMGRVRLMGRDTPVELWEFAPGLPASTTAELRSAWAEFDAGERSALRRIEAIAGEHPQDAALTLLVNRLDRAGPGGVFVLSSK